LVPVSVSTPSGGQRQHTRLGGILDTDRYPIAPRAMVVDHSTGASSC